MIALLVMLSPDVYEIQSVLQLLSSPVSRCTALEIVEALYCVACFLYAFKLAKTADVWNGWVASFQLPVDVCLSISKQSKSDCVS